MRPTSKVVVQPESPLHPAQPQMLWPHQLQAAMQPHLPLRQAPQPAPLHVGLLAPAIEFSEL